MLTKTPTIVVLGVQKVPLGGNKGNLSKSIFFKGQKKYKGGDEVDPISVKRERIKNITVFDVERA